MIVAALALVMQPTATANVRGATIDIPPAIARQVIPYLNCTVQRSNADPRMGTGGLTALRAISADARAACGDVRRQGTEAADRILRRDPRHKDAAARLAFINAAFDQVDRADDALADAVERLKPPAPKAAPMDDAGKPVRPSRNEHASN